MSIAFTFPGQGSQSVGMGKDLADAFPEAREVFEEVDDALGEKLSKVIWEGPEDVLMLTANAQPALMAVSLAAFRALRGARLFVEEQGRLRRRPLARRIFGARRRRHLLDRRRGAAAAYPRQCHAARRAGGRGRHGGDHRARPGRRRGGLRRGREGLGLPDRQRQWRRATGDLRRQGRRSSMPPGCAPKRAPSAPSCCRCRRRSIRR